MVMRLDQGFLPPSPNSGMLGAVLGHGVATAIAVLSGVPFREHYHGIYYLPPPRLWARFSQTVSGANFRRGDWEIGLHDPKISEWEQGHGGGHTKSPKSVCQKNPLKKPSARPIIKEGFILEAGWG